MDCNEFKKVSAGYLTDAVPRERDQEVRDHLAGCPVCAAFVNQVSALREKIRLALCKDCCPDNLRQKVENKIKSCPVRTFFANLFHRKTNKC